MADPTINSPRKATKEELESLQNYHKGGFHQWPLLIDDCKRHVLRFTTLSTKMRLEQCSKSDFELVRHAPVRIQQLSIFDNEPRHWPFGPQQFKNVKVRLTVDEQEQEQEQKSYELVFSQLGEDAQIRWNDGTHSPWIVRNGDFRGEAVKFAETWLKRCQFEVKRIEVAMSSYPFERSCINALPHVHSAKITAPSVDAFRWWLQKLPSRLDRLHLATIYPRFDEVLVPSDLLSSEQVSNATTFYCTCRVDEAMFDEHRVVALKNRHFTVTMARVSDRAMNRLLGEWQSGKRAFQSRTFGCFERDDSAELLRGLGAREWDAAFEDQERDFCVQFRRAHRGFDCYQVPSRVDAAKVLTFAFSNHRFVVVDTAVARIEMEALRRRNELDDEDL